MEIKVKVETVGDLEETPKAVLIKGIKLEVIEIEDRWYSEEYSYFKIFTDNARHYILKRSKVNHFWTAKEIVK